MRTARIGTFLLTALCLATSGTAYAQSRWQHSDNGAVRLRLGVFQPNGGSTYWQDKEIDFTGTANDLKDLSFGADYIWRAGRSWGLIFGFSYYEGDTSQAYRDWQDADGRDIRHTTTLSTSDLTVAWVMQPGERGSRIAPYFGLGGGILWWQLDETGWFIDFRDPALDLFYTSYRESGNTFQAFGLLGVELSLDGPWSVNLEGRYRWADAALRYDFSGLGDIDLSGFELSAGFAFNF